MRGANSTTGVGLIEVYDLDRTVDSKLANISTRGLVQTGDNVMIGGLIVLGADPQNVIVRAIGPSFPLPGKLADPILELHDGKKSAQRPPPMRDRRTEITSKPPLPRISNGDCANSPHRRLIPRSSAARVRALGIALVEAYALN